SGRRHDRVLPAAVVTHNYPIVRDSVLGLSPSVRRTSGPQHDLERGAAARGRAQPEAAADRRRPGAHVLQALTGGDRLLVESGAVVGHADDPLARALGDAHLRAARAGVLARVREPFLDDPEDLDLLVRREPDLLVDLELDLERP